MMDKYYFYQSYYDALKGLKPTVRYAIRDAIDRYMFEDIEPTFKDTLSNSIWMLLLPTLRKSKIYFANGKLKNNSDANSKQTGSKSEANPMQTESKSDANVGICSCKEKEKEKEKDKDKDNIPPVIPPKGGKFVPPTLDEVKAYIKEKGYNFDAEEFLAHYEANGWVQGNDKKTIKSWKACCVTWKKNSSRYGTKNSFHDRAFGTDQNVEVGF